MNTVKTVLTSCFWSWWRKSWSWLCLYQESWQCQLTSTVSTKFWHGFGIDIKSGQNVSSQHVKKVLTLKKIKSLDSSWSWSRQALEDVKTPMLSCTLIFKRSWLKFSFFNRNRSLTVKLKSDSEIIKLQNKLLIQIFILKLWKF